MTHLALLFLLLSHFAEQHLVRSFGLAPPRQQSRQRQRANDLVVASATSANDPTLSQQQQKRQETKQQLFDLLATVPRNAVTSRQQTQAILHQVRQLEPQCPTNATDVLTTSAGTWELWWTAQDGDASGPLSKFRWINPLENQAYSNNPTGSGRSNPLLPLEVQNFLTKQGILSTDDDNNNEDDGESTATSGRTSTQTINVQKGQVINVVSLPLAGFLSSSPATLTVRVDFSPSAPDPRRVNVKFQSFAVTAGKAIKWNFPLGIVGPTGWLRTTYVDDNLRITRGHKGSVFVLQRPKNRSSGTRQQED